MFSLFKFFEYLFQSVLTKSNVPNLIVTGLVKSLRKILIKRMDLKLSIPLIDLKKGLYLLLL